jgi:predicted hotdog family 3-hydroxylacyl-ACP dehydratase
VRLLWLALLLAGCVSAPHVNAPITVGASSAWPLLSPVSLQQTRRVTQVLRGDYADNSFTLRSVVTVDAQQLTVIGLTSMGLRAFTLKYDGHNLAEERAPQVPESLQSRQLLNDLQLAFWPLATLQQAWQAQGGAVSEPYPGTRRLHRAGVLLVEVHYAADAWNGRVWLRHFDTPYSLFIETSPMPEFSMSQLLPHEGSMLLIDELLRRDDEVIITTLTIRTDSTFCDGVSGVPAWVGMEYMAQTACAYLGVAEARAGKAASISLLLGTRSYRASVPVFTIGTRLVISAHLLVRDDDDLVVFQCRIRDADTQAELAVGDIKAIRPASVHALIEEQLHG